LRGGGYGRVNRWAWAWRILLTILGRRRMLGRLAVRVLRGGGRRMLRAWVFS
jgi:hypothetical protein